MKRNFILILFIIIAFVLRAELHFAAVHMGNARDWQTALMKNKIKIKRALIQKNGIKWYRDSILLNPFNFWLCFTDSNEIVILKKTSPLRKETICKLKESLDVLSDNNDTIFIPFKDPRSIDFTDRQLIKSFNSEMDMDFIFVWRHYMFSYIYLFGNPKRELPNQAYVTRFNARDFIEDDYPEYLAACNSMSRKPLPMERKKFVENSEIFTLEDVDFYLKWKEAYDEKILNASFSHNVFEMPIKYINNGISDFTTSSISWIIYMQQEEEI